MEHNEIIMDSMENINDLQDLCDYLNAARRFMSDEAYKSIDLSSLPTFGGPDAYGTEAYSWDETHLLFNDGFWYLEER